MITQHYRINIPQPRPELNPGQFVFANNDSDTVIGFISSVNDTWFSIMLFEPTNIEFKEHMTNISNICDYKKTLASILESDDDIREMWTDPDYYNESDV